MSNRGLPSLQNVSITDSDAFAIRQAFAAVPIYDDVTQPTTPVAIMFSWPVEH